MLLYKFHCTFKCTYYINCKLYNGLDVLYPRTAQLPVNEHTVNIILYSIVMSTHIYFLHSQLVSNQAAIYSKIV